MINQNFLFHIFVTKNKTSNFNLISNSRTCYLLNSQKNINDKPKKNVWGYMLKKKKGLVGR